jgi:hypothetical protein
MSLSTEAPIWGGDRCRRAWIVERHQPGMITLPLLSLAESPPDRNEQVDHAHQRMQLHRSEHGVALQLRGAR